MLLQLAIMLWNFIKFRRRKKASIWKHRQEKLLFFFSVSIKKAFLKQASFCDPKVNCEPNGLYNHIITNIIQSQSKGILLQAWVVTERDDFCEIS